MITNKDIRVENGFLIINGDKYPLDGQSPAAIMQIVEDNSDTTPIEESTAPVQSGGVYSALDDITDIIGDITQTGITGATVAAQLGELNDTTKIEKVPDTFITLESGVSITTNQLFKQGNHIFGWITFGFSAQTPTDLKLGVLDSVYSTNYLIRMVAGLGTEGWKSDYIGYANKGTDNGLYVTGYTSGIKAAHIHLDYVV